MRNRQAGGVISSEKLPVAIAAVSAVIASTVFGVVDAGAQTQSTAASLPTFEVASVKPCTGDPRTQTTRSWGDVTPRVTLEHIDLRAVLLRVFDLQPGQLSGPAWLGADFFDILANVPAGAPREQVPLMFQALLADRFKLKFHREIEVAQVYALVVGEGGPKLKEAVPDETSLALPGKIAGNGERSTSGTGAAGAWGRFKMTLVSGALHFEFASTTMKGLAEFLSYGSKVDLPVVDMTELKGSYQVPLDVPARDMLAPRGSLAAGQHDADQAVPEASEPSGASVGESVEKLGLKLERRRLPVEKFVVDHIERTPTEN